MTSLISMLDTSDIQQLIAHDHELTIHEAGEGESVTWQKEIRVSGHLSVWRRCAAMLQAVRPSLKAAQILHAFHYRPPEWWNKNIQ